MLLAPAVVGTLALLVVTARGPYASPDAAHYVGVARSLVDGGGLDSPPGSPPLSHFPPLFPLVLAGLAAPTGVDPLDVAGVLNPLLFGGAAALVAFAVRRRTASLPAGVVASALAVCGLDLLVFGASALSEPLFSVLVLSSLLTLAAGLRRDRTGLVVAAGALAGGALLTRYVGAAVVVAGVVALLRLDHGRGGRRALVFGAVAVAPTVLWLAYAGGQARTVAFHLFDLRFWTTGLHTLSKWVLPPFLPWPVRVAAGVGLVALAVGWRRLGRPGRAVFRETPGDPLAFVLAAFTVAYLALLVAGRLLLDDSGRLDGRFLGPLHLVALVGLAPAGVTLVRRARSIANDPARWVTAIATALLLLHATNAAVWVGRGITDDSVERRGFTGRDWEESAVVAAIARLPASVQVFSNAPDALFLLSGRRTERLPSHHDLLTGRANGDYDADLSRLVTQLRHGGAMVAWFAPLRYRDRFLTPEVQVRTRLSQEDDDPVGGLDLVATDRVGTLYRAGPVP